MLRVGGCCGRCLYELLVSIRDYRGYQRLRASSGGLDSLPQLRVDCLLQLLLSEGVSGKAAYQRLGAGRQRLEASAYRLVYGLLCLLLSLLLSEDDW